MAGVSNFPDRGSCDYRLTKDMKDAAAALNLPLATAAMILRQIYADAPGQGEIVWNMGPRASDAAVEVEQLFREILPEACRAKTPNAKRLSTRRSSAKRSVGTKQPRRKGRGQ